MKIDDLARIVHEANRAYCLALGDTSQVAWDEAPDWQKGSAIAGVLWRLEHQAARAGEGHEQWFKRKADEGWVYGPEKNVEALTHPCMRPFEDLPPEQQAKDVLFRAIVNSLAHLVER